MESWIKQMIGSLDGNLDDETKIQIMGSCGEECPFTHLTDERLLVIRNASKDEQDFLEELSKQWRVSIENGNFFVIFDKCYCPLVGEDTAGFSKTLCYCTQGNLKKKFRIGLGRDVDVVMESTILSGDDECRFRILV